jgi:hypothetical protein
MYTLFQFYVHVGRSRDDHSGPDPQSHHAQVQQDYAPVCGEQITVHPNLRLKRVLFCNGIYRLIQITNIVVYPCLFCNRSICRKKFCSNLESQCCGSRSGIRCLFDPWIWDPGWVKIRIRIGDEQPVSYFLELRNNFLG